eukprot:10481435-Alexandrium_andersonii.AAC.1
MPRFLSAYHHLPAAEQQSFKDDFAERQQKKRDHLQRASHLQPDPAGSAGASSDEDRPLGASRPTCCQTPWG